MGRTPNSDRYNPHYDDYYHIDAVNGTTQFTDSECNASVTKWTGAEFVVKASTYNKWNRHRITGHTGTTLTYSGGASNYPVDNGFGYFIQNDIRTLDQFGEWFYGSDKFYMYFGAVDPATKTVKVSTKDQLIDIGGSDFITIKNISFEGANENAIETNTSAHAYNLTIDNCNFNMLHTGIYGHRAYEMIVTNCVFVNMTNQAIYNHWYSDGAYIAHNTIDSTGLVIGAGESSWYTGKAMTITFARHDYSDKDVIIEYNTVTNSGFTGIHFGEIVRK
jgi:hypothetical protein